MHKVKSTHKFPELGSLSSFPVPYFSTLPTKTQGNVKSAYNVISEDYKIILTVQ